MPKVSQLSVNQTMTWVTAACIPALAVLTYWQGMGFLINLGTAIFAGYAFDQVQSFVKQRKFSAMDPATTVTAILFAAGVPAFAPYWVMIVGMFFGIVIARNLYGGVGHNIFNPAMVAYAVVLIGFPTHMVVWPAWALDSISAATPLDHANAQLTHPLWPCFVINGAWLLGGCILLFKKIIRWMIPAGVFIGMLMTALFFPNPLEQLGLGATMICAFFIATDPVTAPGDPRVRFFYGVFIGFLIIMMRQFSSYPDGVAFSVLLANMCTPLMDHLSIRKSP